MKTIGQMIVGQYHEMKVKEYKRKELASKIVSSLSENTVLGELDLIEIVEELLKEHERNNNNQ